MASAASAASRSSTQRLPDFERSLDALGVAQALRVLNGQPAGENAPLSEVVGVAPLPEMNIAHWLYSPLSLLLAAAFPDITRQPPRSRYQLK
jgi:hypothetical protein